jgi:hypothetical protein
MPLPSRFQAETDAVLISHKRATAHVPPSASIISASFVIVAMLHPQKLLGKAIAFAARSD